MIYKYALEGKGLSQICRILNDDGYKRKNGKPFTHTQISQILHIRVYAGLTTDSSNVKEMTSTIYTPFVSPEDFHKVQAMYPQTVTSKKMGRPNEYAGSGLLKCSHCESSYTHWIGWCYNHKANGKKVKVDKISYVHNARLKCPSQKYYNASVLDWIIEDAYIYSLFNSKSIIETIKKMVKDDTAINDIERLNYDIDQLEAQLEEYNKAIASGGKNIKIIIKTMKDLENQIYDLEKVRREKQSIIKEKELDYFQALKNLSMDNLAKYQSGTGREKNHLIRQVVKTILADKDEITIVFIDNSTLTYNFKKIRIIHKKLAIIFKRDKQDTEISALHFSPATLYDEKDAKEKAIGAYKNESLFFEPIEDDNVEIIKKMLMPKIGRLE